MFGLYWDNGKENGNSHIIGLYGSVLCWGYIGPGRSS